MTAQDRWYVAQTQARKERVAIANLERQSFKVYCPTLRRTRRHARKFHVGTHRLAVISHQAGIWLGPVTVVGRQPPLLSSPARTRATAGGQVDVFAVHPGGAGLVSKLAPGSEAENPLCHPWGRPGW